MNKGVFQSAHTRRLFPSSSGRTNHAVDHSSNPRFHASCFWWIAFGQLLFDSSNLRIHANCFYVFNTEIERVIFQSTLTRRLIHSPLNVWGLPCTSNLCFHENCFRKNTMNESKPMRFQSTLMRRLLPKIKIWIGGCNTLPIHTYTLTVSAIFNSHNLCVLCNLQCA